ncbi:MAG TPA: YciI family protein [Candidatus Polarisedimenticolaceae bacterium]|nr:YciI family protein [Candidatus Polarisedimenticolaceae bacterium]
MRFMILHKTNPRWEAGEIPSPELIARVGALIGELARSGRLEAGEGLRASAEGVRLRFRGGEATVTPGPFRGENESTAGFTILRVASREEAVQWGQRLAAILGEGEIDIRPVTEAWDIGMMPRPEKLTARRYMVLRKEGSPPTPEQRAAIAGVVEEARRTGTYLGGETLKPSARGRRYKNSKDGVTVTDGPFAESKELIAGYVLVRAESLEEAGRLAERYLAVVEAEEVDVREVEG